jgi:vacuole membrane protein 1
LATAKDVLLFVFWWIGLGIASSIGLGTGLHTFLLYLGPHIAKVAVVSHECGFIPAQVPSRWSFEYFEECQKQGEIKIYLIVLAVQLESLLWGLGTVIGELPPYFLAKNAREDKFEDQDEGKIQQFLRKGLQKHAFITICLCASVPNPLFDLAGLMAGHFGVPFLAFFTATLIGKALIKVQIQVLFTTLLFSDDILLKTFNSIEYYFPVLRNYFTDILKNQKNSLFQSKSQNKSIIGILWDIFISIMVLFFIISLLNSIVKREHVTNM